MRRSLGNGASGLKPLYPRERLHRFADLQQQLSDMDSTRLRTMDSLHGCVVLTSNGFGDVGRHGQILSDNKSREVPIINSLALPYLSELFRQVSEY